MPTTTITARKWIAPTFGGADVLTQVSDKLPPPGAGEVTIEVRAAGMNPADYKRFAAGDPNALPVRPGFEVAGVIAAIGPNTEIASGGGAVGDEVLAFRVAGGYASAITTSAHTVLAKPASLSFEEASGLLLAGTTAAEMLHVTGVAEGDTILVHGGSSACGVSVIQQARLKGARVIATASTEKFSVVERFGAEPVEYGEGLEQRVREAAPDGIDAALDCVGRDEAIDASLALVADRDRVVTIANMARAAQDGFTAIGGSMPASAAFRDEARAGLIALAGEGKLIVPIAKTFPLDDAPAAVEYLQGRHAPGKVALIP